MLSTSVTAMESSLHPPAHQCSAWCMKERKQAGKTDVASHGKQRSRRNNVSRGGGIRMCPLISTSPRYSIQFPCIRYQAAHVHGEKIVGQVSCMIELA